MVMPISQDKKLTFSLCEHKDLPSIFVAELRKQGSTSWVLMPPVMASYEIETVLSKSMLKKGGI